MTDVVARLPTLRAPAVSSWRRRIAAAGGLIGLVALAAADGGYFAPAWGCAALALGWVIVFRLISGGAAVSGREVAFVGLFAALAAWTLLSAAWSPSLAVSLHEGFRALLLPLSAGCAVLLLKRAGLAGPLAVAWAGIVAVCVYALGTRLLPDRLGVFDPIAGYRLSEPLGYWNALGIFAALGLLLGVALVIDAGTRWIRVAAAASLPLLALTTYFTFSRGAWAALALGVLAQIVLDPTRGRLALVVLALLPAPALAVAAATRADALTRVDAQFADAVADGHRVLAWLFVLTALGAFSGLMVTHITRDVERAGRVMLALAACFAAFAVVAAPGAPQLLPGRAWHAFRAPAPDSGRDLSRRLHSISGSGRVEQWEVALEQARKRPVTGEGAGSYEAYWLQQRADAGKVRDAHSLYIELLGELGVIGLVLLLAAIALPVVAAVKGRRHALVPGAFGAYAAYLAHAGVDWDWEMPAITLTAVFVGVALLAAAPEAQRPLTLRARRAAVVATLAVMLLAFVGLVGNIALSQAARAARAGDWNASIDYTRQAKTWAPWSPEPYRHLGEAELALGRSSRARASYTRAIEKAPRDWSLWFDLARASTGVEQRRALARAAELNPLSPEVAQFRKELRQ